MHGFFGFVLKLFGHGVFLFLSFSFSRAVSLQRFCLDCFWAVSRPASQTDRQGQDTAARAVGGASKRKRKGENEQDKQEAKKRKTYIMTTRTHAYMASGWIARWLDGLGG